MDVDFSSKPSMMDTLVDKDESGGGRDGDGVSVIGRLVGREVGESVGGVLSVSGMCVVVGASVVGISAFVGLAVGASVVGTSVVGASVAGASVVWAAGFDVVS